MSDVSDLAAKCGGEFLPWSQRTPSRPAARGGHVNLRGGACGEYCAVWMQNVRAKQEVPTNKNLLDDTQWIISASSVHEYMAAHGFRLLTNFSGDYPTAAPGAIVDQVLKSGPGYYLLTVSDVPQNSAPTAASKVHGVAFVHMKTYQFFDPNWGVAKFKSAEGLGSYFPAYFKLKLSIFPLVAYMEKYVG
jgi:hypothetical protein